MHYAYTVTRPEACYEVFAAAQALREAISKYLDWLPTLAQINEPRGIVFHDLISATTIFSSYVLPAWTDHSLIHIDPLLEDWKQIYLSTLSQGIPFRLQTAVRGYYKSLDYADIATIVAHELTHHLQTFMDTPEEAMWFEEGFCFYVSRSQLLTETRLHQLQHVEKLLIDAHYERLGDYPVWQFGKTDTGESFADALFDYWRAIRAVSILIDTYADGSCASMLHLFQAWKRQPQQHKRLDVFLLDALKVPTTARRTLYLSV